MRGVAIALVLVLVGIGVGAYALLREESKEPGTGKRAAPVDSASTDRSHGSPAHVHAAEAADAERTSEPGDGANAPAVTLDEFAEFRGEGSILLRIVDAQDDSPLADLPFIVYSERPRMHVTMRGVTDANGEAEIRELPEDVVIFETPRRPPHANTIYATWLKARDRKPVVMRVGRGGTVRGRVVDDLGSPLEGVDVRFDARPGSETLASMQAVQATHPEAAKRFETRTTLVTKTASDGRFAVDAILSRPAAIWIEDGGMSPKREDEVALTFWWRVVLGVLTTRVHEGETVELPDLVLARSRIFAGRVLDPEGRGVGGALISTRNERRYLVGRRAFDAPLAESRRDHRFGEVPEPADFRFDLLPGEGGFTLALDESITAADGAFELEVSPAFTFPAFVAAPNGAQAFFDLPNSTPGSRTEGLEFRLRPETQILLEVTEPDGTSLKTQDDRASDVQPQVVAIGKDGSETRTEIRRASPTTFAVRIDAAPEKFTKLVISARDHDPASLDLTATPIGRPTLSIALAPKVVHVLRFRFELAEPADRARLGPSNLELCALARPRPNTGVDGGEGGSHESVVGSVNFAPSKTLDVDLRVPAKRRWVVEVNGPFVADEGGWGPIELGAFEPDGERIEIELPRVSDAWIAAQELKKKQREEHDRLLANPPEPGFITVRATDARSGKELHGFLSLERHSRPDEVETPHGIRWQQDYTFNRGGNGSRWAVAPGRHDVTVQFEGYRRSAQFTVDVTAKETTDLGSVALEPLPDYRLKCITATEGQPTSRWNIRLEELDESSGSRILGAIWMPDANGVIGIRRELPDPVVIHAWPGEGRWSSEGSLSARFELARWDPATTAELALPRACSVRILLDLSQIEPELRMGSVIARRVDGTSRAARSSTQAVPSSQSLDASRAFTFFAPAGRVEVRASGPCFAAPVTSIELADTDEVQEFTLVAQSR